MDTEDKKILDKILLLAEQNNRILRKMRRDVLVGKFLHLLYWVLIIGVSVAGYYYIKPYIGNLTAILQSMDKIKSLIPK